MLVVQCGGGDPRNAGVPTSLAATTGLCVVMRRWEGDEREIRRLAREAILVLVVGSGASALRRLRRLCGPRLCRSSLTCLACAEASLCIFTFPCSATPAVLDEMVALLRVMRCTRERLFVVAVRSGTAAEQDLCRKSATAEDHAWWDALLEYPPKGYDIFPFAEALAAIEEGSLKAPPLSPYVTKLHTKTDAGWRWRLSACAYACPLRQDADTIVS